MNQNKVISSFIMFRRYNNLFLSGLMFTDILGQFLFSRFLPSRWVEGLRSEEGLFSGCEESLRRRWPKRLGRAGPGRATVCVVRRRKTRQCDLWPPTDGGQVRREVLTLSSCSFTPPAHTHTHTRVSSGSEPAGGGGSPLQTSRPSQTQFDPFDPFPAQF